MLGQPLAELDYAARQAAVMAAGLAIWDDSYGRCERQGSLDTAIRNGRANDFDSLKTTAPRLVRVCFNGQAAGRFEKTLALLGYQTVVLPSTSPANAGGASSASSRPGAWRWRRSGRRDRRRIGGGSAAGLWGMAAWRHRSPAHGLARCLLMVRSQSAAFTMPYRASKPSTMPLGQADLNSPFG